MKIPTNIWPIAGLVLVLSVPAYAASPYDAPSARAVQWLVQHQNGDGSWGNTADVRYPDTVEAVLALRALNQRIPAYYWGIAWLENHGSLTVDYRARRILALGPHGDDVTADLSYLTSAQKTSSPGNGGWGLSSTYQGDAQDTALALLALSQAGVTANAQAAIDYLKSAQLTGPDNGWAVGQEAGGDPQTTAIVVQALSAWKSFDPSLTAPIAGGVASLAAKVDSGSPPHFQALAALAYIRAGFPASATPLLSSLTASQSGADGSWSGDVYATALAARTFAAAMGTDNAGLSTSVYIPDPDLRAAVNAALGKNAMDGLSQGDLANLTTLSAAGTGIYDLTGLEWAVNLTTADLRNNRITSTAPLSGLTNLASVQLDGNPVTATPVPAMSNWVLLITAFLLTAIMFFRNRRRRTEV